MVSVERLASADDVLSNEQESEWNLPGDSRLAEDWTQGTLEFDHYSTQYNQSENSQLALADISLCVKEGEKVAIVGRTGSGCLYNTDGNGKYE
jgi:ABC-type bacteriocin/lantibiotic exporter with double-glycine peptidase domain